MRRKHLTPVPVVVLLSALAGAAPGVGQDVVKETLVFLDADGRSMVTYATTRSSYGTYNMFLDDGESIDDYMYVFPRDYRVEREGDRDVVRFGSGDWAVMEEGSLEDRITPGPDGTLTFFSGDEPGQGEHFGYWNTPVDYRQFVYAWIVPETVELLSWESNREGDWIRRERTLTWYGSGVNDLTFTIRYRLRTAGLYAALESGLAGRDDASLEQTADGVLLTLADAILFPSGSAELTAQGRAVLGEVVGSLDDPAGLRLAVQGHTDDVAITGALAERWPTNWELSAARALAVVKALMEAGVPPTSLEARAFGEHQPVAANDGPEGRARNRRVEILISGG
jgi:flagellar motor protein MotB